MSSFLLIRSTGEQQLVSSEKQKIRIGRLPDNEIWIDDPSVSRRHATLTLDDGNPVLSDLGSRNGTSVNGTRISSTTLSSGDIIGVGTVRIIYEPSIKRGVNSAKEDVTSETLSMPSPAGRSTPPMELLETVADIARQIGGDRSLEELLNSILVLCVEKTGAERASIMLLNDAGQLVPCAYFSTIPSSDPFAISRTMARKAMTENKAQLLRDVAGFAGPDMSESLYGLKARSAICAPLCAGETTIGVFFLDTTRHERQFGEVDLLFFSTLSAMIAEKVANVRLSEIAREKRRLDAELVAASDIQAHLFPAELPTVAGYDLSVRVHPCREIGGDYFDVFAVGGTYVITIADVVGKGIGAAMLMSNLQAMVRSLAQQFSEPSLLLEKINADLISRVGEGRFITCFLMTLNSRNHQIRYANAGHNQPLLCRCTGEIVPLDFSFTVNWAFVPIGISNLLNSLYRSLKKSGPSQKCGAK
ncbi:GAF domain-containing protein [Syntrophus gentianae]|uniref:GAF domain-containing protein n=1 Tax=Syntrophus gentianae TaxID=43775 RepID=A0A1H7XL66_9BACT|nr:SpoIIE family protein phosphatase [Syntrophus gentianae]SEM33917.1 GAF domain-containing protein [Syntrophus gentianae]